MAASPKTKIGDFDAIFFDSYGLKFLGSHSTNPHYIKLHDFESLLCEANDDMGAVRMPTSLQKVIVDRELL